MKRTPTKWYRTGDQRIAPWWFGIMRAEFLERRDFPGYGFDKAGDPEDDGGSYQLRWVGAGALPESVDSMYSPFGFYSMLAQQNPNTEQGRWKKFISYWPRGAHQ